MLVLLVAALVTRAPVMPEIAIMFLGATTLAFNRLVALSPRQLIGPYWLRRTVLVVLGVLIFALGAVATVAAIG